MLSEDDNKFIEYWASQREKKKQSLRHFTIGLPLGVCIVLALFANVVWGWHKRAAQVLFSNSSLILIILLAAIGIVVFMTVFSMRYQWEQKEQKYQELLLKKDKEQKEANLE